MFAQKRKANPTSAIICGIIALIAALIVGIMGLQSPPELKNVEDITAADMSTDYSYEIEELFIIDHYMTISGDSKSGSNGKYYVAGFYGEDGKLYLTSLHADGDDDLQEELDDYINDADAKIGDLEISGCFKTRKVTAVDSDEEIYGPFISKVKSMFLGEGISCVDTKLHLDYVCEDSADYEAEASMTYMLAVAAVFALIGGVLLFFGTKAKKKLKEEEEARARFNENQPTTPEF